jgi:hypothetical protein
MGYEEPASESAKAREAVLRVRDALRVEAPSSTRPPPGEPVTRAAEELASPWSRRSLDAMAAPVQPATPETSPAPTQVCVVRAPAALAGTSTDIELPAGPALPFTPAGMGAASRLAARPPLHPSVVRAPESLTGTSDEILLPAGPALPFREPSGPAPVVECHPIHPAVRRAPSTLTGTSLEQLPRVPELPFAAGAATRPAAPDLADTQELDHAGLAAMLASQGTGGALAALAKFAKAPGADELTLDHYAELRAHLTIKGEDDLDTLARFGIRTHSAKEALQARFAARFQQDPAAQAYFVDRVRSLTNDLRESAARKP